MKSNGAVVLTKRGGGKQSSGRKMLTNVYQQLASMSIPFLFNVALIHSIMP